MVMFKVRGGEGPPTCIARAEGSFNVMNKPHIALDCIEAVMQNDAREVYFLDRFLIKQWADWSCLVP